ncbi:hypothetical protein PGTUg99_000836 [Puccinia graminis f. sp. tritici]|uniref:SAM-dependent MTase RsmB/NOP-type domain-containing protein n=1 Tax=Puccinia graminis f. sp. tritici TaxID=56615 RepID=A0A5B0RQI1_PUCGR|nr:hypothetical protein PGTUg99_030659 [Puccinia graminis f. sp. tritici]KAA1127592.1 hypothetical protein PGTUg99_000836 [Puccinia graminis f. sp. tritici]
MEFYNQAARAIDRVNNKHGSLKSIVFNLAANSNTKNKQPQAGSSASSIKARQVSDGKRLLRVVAETLRYRQVIESILSVVDVLRLESKVFGSSSKSSKGTSSKQNERWQHPSAHSLVLILIHDHLFSSRGIALSKIHKIRAAIERHSSALKAELSRLMVRQAVSRVSDLADSFQRGTDSVDEDSGGTNLNSPRWMRVNTIKWSVDQAKGWFIDAGWTQVSSLEALTNQTSDSPDQLLVFAEDEHVAGLLALPSAVVLAKLAPYVDGRLIAQDKASCMPAQLLLGDHPHNPPIEVIDATAAPGNKTTMLSSIVGPRGKVWAFEKDKQRFKVLTEMIKLAGCTRISNRLDHLSQTDSQKKRDENRIQSLSRFQTTIVSHALRFPSVHQVAYSTCSIWQEENEEVVFRILNKPEMIDKRWSLKEVKDTFLNNSKTPWGRTGEVISTKEKHLSERMIRFDPSVDQTIGFFAAVFHRPVPQPGPASAKKAERSTSTAITQKTERAHHPKTSCDETPLPFAQSPKLIVTGKKEKMRTKRTVLFHGIRPGRLISI